MSIGVILNYGRSGGTLLNRCLGTLPNVVIKSEVSPYRQPNVSGQPVTVQQQASQWYGNSLQSNEFAESIVELHEKCYELSKRLIIRLWCVGEFRPSR